MFKRMYSQKFNEGLFPPSRRQGGEISISWEDKTFLSLINESAKRIRDHYELPLPFRNDPKMLNNRHQALQRLIYLKNKLERNPTFFGHYKEFMDTLFQRVMQKNLLNLLLRANAGMFHIMESTMTINLTKLELCSIAVQNTKVHL